MNKTVINVRVDKKIKAKAQKVAGELGFSLSSLVNGYLHNLITTKTVFFPPEEPNEYLKKLIKQAEEEYRQGRASPSFSTAKDAVQWLESNSPRKYERKVQRKV